MHLKTQITCTVSTLHSWPSGGPVPLGNSSLEGLWVLPGTLRQITDGLVVGKRRGQGLHHFPTWKTCWPHKEPYPRHPLPPSPWGAAGALLPCSYGFLRSPRFSFLSLEGPPRSVRQPKVAAPSTTHTQCQPGSRSISSGHCPEPSETRSSVTCSHKFTRNTG